MTDILHETLLERMPDVARGAESWSADESAHLAACAECRAAWMVVSRGARVGAAVERGFDASGAARAVTARLRASSTRARAWRWTGLGIAAAAAITLAVVGPRTAPPAPVVPPAVAGARFLPELDSLSTEELTAVAEGLDLPASRLDIIEGQPLFDLDSTQLERVLRSLEG